MVEVMGAVEGADFARWLNAFDVVPILPLMPSEG